MFVNRRIVLYHLDCLEEVFLGPVQLIQLEEGPSEAVQVGAIVWLECKRLFNVIDRFLETDTTIGQHITDVIQGAGVLRIGPQNLLEERLCLLELLLSLINGGKLKLQSLAVPIAQRFEPLRPAQDLLRIRI